MKHRLSFTSKVCALVVGCLLVCGGIKAQPVYWSQPGAPYNPLKNADGPGAITYMGIVVYEAYYNDSLNTISLSEWDGYEWTTYTLPDTFDQSEGFQSWQYSGIEFSICNDINHTIYISGPFGNNNGTLILTWNNGTWGICGQLMGINQQPVFSLCSDHIGNIYASFIIDTGQSYSNSQLIEKWNGISWTVLPLLAYNGESQETASIAVDASNNLYAVGSNNSFAGEQSLYEYNGNSWATVLYNSMFYGFFALCGSNTNIYIETNDGTIVYWNGSQFIGLPLIHSPNNQIVTMQTDYQGNLYVAGYLTDSSGWTFVDKWDGTSWTELGTNNFALHGNGFIQNMAVVGPDNVFVSGYFTNYAGNYYVAESNQLLPGRLFDYILPTQANCGNTGYITSNVYGGTPPYTYLWSNGQTTSICDSLQSGTYFVTVTDVNGLVTTGDVFLSGNCQTFISGTVFADTAGTCLYNGNQTGLPNVTLTLSGDSQTLYATTDGQGQYSFEVSDTGNYYLYIQVGNTNSCGNFTLCGNPSQTIHVESLGDIVSGNNFALKPDASSFDLYLHPGWTSADPGFEKDYWVYFANNSPVPFTGNATVAFKYDSNLTFISSDIPYSSYNAATDSFTWAINNFSNSGWNYIGEVRFHVPSTLPLGYQLHSQFWIYPDAGDCDTTNNYLQYYETVKGSHDPNYKEVSPAGYSTAVDSVLTYTIHYQNTGTDSTYFIVVKDTLSPYLNPATVRNLASSDSYSSFSISGTGILTWTFLPLSLPAASTDSMASNGFITFSVKRMSNTPTGTNITNTASVYFDYNSPVRTNTVTDTVSCIDTLSQFAPLCAGDSVYFYGRWIHTPGSYDTLLVGNPCDTFVTIGIVVQYPLPPHNISDTICANDSLLFAGTYLHSTGTYADTLTGTGGCDSIVRLQLTVLAVQQTNFNKSICSGASYNFNDSLLTLTGTYTATVTGANGCDSVVTLHLTVNPHPLQPFITQQGDTLLSSDGTGNQWYLNDTALIGDTSNLLIVAQHGSYQVEVTGPNGCQNISAAYLYTSTGIGSLSNGFDMALYPNPNGGLFNIEFSDNTAKEVTVTDMLGQTVFPVKTVVTKGEFDLSPLASGIYFLKVKDLQNNNRVVFKQVVIQH